MTIRGFPSIEAFRNVLGDTEAAAVGEEEEEEEEVYMRAQMKPVQPRAKNWKERSQIVGLWDCGSKND